MRKPPRPPRLPTLPKAVKPRGPTTASGKLPIKSKSRPAPALASADPRGNVEAHTYNPETGHLDVTFRGGRQYRYDGVSKETAQKLAQSGSAGAFLHAHVIGKHDVTKL